MRGGKCLRRAVVPLSPQAVFPRLIVWLFFKSHSIFAVSQMQRGSSPVGECVGEQRSACEQALPRVAPVFNVCFCVSNQ